jgi:anthraniloyl-CoA monooxygenase
VKIVTVGGGPAALYLAILVKKLDPSHEVTVLERNGAAQTFGWGVVFSDETLGNLLEADAPTHEAIARTFARWDRIDVFHRGARVTSRGHGFCGIARMELLRILYGRCRELGVDLRFDTEVTEYEGLLRGHDLVVAADGLRSGLRTAYAEHFGPSLDGRACRYIWLGTTRTFDAFTFLFKETPHGLFQVHAYRFDQDTSTFIVECHADTWRRAGYDTLPVEDSVRELEALFAEHLGGHGLRTNRSQWVQFATVKNRAWHHRNVVLLGDAAHTAHFSIGSGTKLAMEDAIELAASLGAHPGDLPGALAAYEVGRRGMVERIQKAAQDSLQWFEHAGRYVHLDPLQFTFSLLSRSKRISYENLRRRDPAFVAQVTGWYARAQAPPGTELPATTPPMFTPLRLRGLELGNRVVVSPMCMYSSVDGMPGEFQLVHLGARAQGGAGLVMTEMTDVLPEGRITPGCAGLYTPEHRDAWRRVVAFVHTHTRAKIGMQLGHAGRKGATCTPWGGGYDEPLSEGAWALLAPSALPYLPRSQVPRAMDAEDRARVTAAYVRAARWADEAGFDLLELHCAHGYLLASYLSPLTNRRTDAYGGPVENRLRYPLEVFDAVRAAWPSHKPMSVRISATDWAPGGLSDEDAVSIARALKAHGCDLLDVSTGQTDPVCAPVYGRMFQTPWSDLLRHEAGIATMTVGAIFTPDQVNSILAAGRADLCALARAHLADPSWTLRAAEDLGFEAQPWPVQYTAGRGLPRGERR